VVIYCHGAPTSRLDLVAALADHLQVDRFLVPGLSAGGPYAVACGADGSRFFEFTTLAPADAALLEDHDRAQTLLATIVESFRQGVRGLAADLTIQGMPWPFDPSAVRAPTVVLHGDADPYLPVAHGRHTAEVIPNARFVLKPGQGHVSLIRVIPQLCTDLLALAKEAAR
jgi:pimeloyl-ACP methyl ester carboxylesterase